MDKPKNIKRCPLCGWDTNRTSFTIVRNHVTSAPLCARCHKGMQHYVGEYLGGYTFDNYVGKYNYLWECLPTCSVTH